MGADCKDNMSQPQHFKAEYRRVNVRPTAHSQIASRRGVMNSPHSMDEGAEVTPRWSALCELSQHGSGRAMIHRLSDSTVPSPHPWSYGHCFNLLEGGLACCHKKFTEVNFHYQQNHTKCVNFSKLFNSLDFRNTHYWNKTIDLGNA